LVPCRWEQARVLAGEIKLLTAAAWSEQPAGLPRSRLAEGVRARHSRSCPGSQGRACACSPRWEAWVWSRSDKRKIRKTFPERWEAKAWRHEQLDLASIDRLRAPSRLSLAEAGSRWVEMARDGRIRNRSGPSLQAERATHHRDRSTPASCPEARHEGHGRGHACGSTAACWSLAGSGQEPEQDPVDHQRRASALARPGAHHRPRR
jgi:hypothetical protein